MAFILEYAHKHTTWKNIHTLECLYQIENDGLGTSLSVAK